MDPQSSDTKLVYVDLGGLVEFCILESVGFAGVSVSISRVLARRLFFTSFGFEVSAKVNTTPKRLKTLVQMR